MKTVGADMRRLSFFPRGSMSLLASAGNILFRRAVRLRRRRFIDPGLDERLKLRAVTLLFHFLDRDEFQ